MIELTFDEIKEMNLYDEKFKKLLTRPEQIEEAKKYAVEKIQKETGTTDIKFKGFTRVAIVNHLLLEHIKQK